MVIKILNIPLNSKYWGLQPIFSLFLAGFNNMLKQWIQ